MKGMQKNFSCQRRTSNFAICADIKMLMLAKIKQRILCLLGPGSLLQFGGTLSSRVIQTGSNKTVMQPKTNRGIEGFFGDSRTSGQPRNHLMDQSPTTTKRVWILRHGIREDFEDQTWALTAEDPENSPLSQRGHLQATEVSKFLLETEHNIKHIFCSPFLRTIQTAHPVAEVLNLSIGIESETKIFLYSSSLDMLFLKGGLILALPPDNLNKFPGPPFPYSINPMFLLPHLVQLMVSWISITGFFTRKFIPQFY